MNQKPARRLYRSRQNRRLAGVAGGIAEYFGVDATVVRVLLLLLLLIWFPLAPIIYVALALIIPNAPDDQATL